MSEEPWPPPVVPTAPAPVPRDPRGRLIIAVGLLLGFFPVIVPIVASIFVSDALNESTTLGTLPWLTIFTVPLAVIGIVVTFAIRRSIRQR